MQRTLALVVDGIKLGADVEQLSNVRLLSRGGSNEKRCPSHCVASLQVRLVREEQLKHAQVIGTSRPVQGRTSILLLADNEPWQSERRYECETGIMIYRDTKAGANATLWTPAEEGITHVIFLVDKPRVLGEERSNETRLACR